MEEDCENLRSEDFFDFSEDAFIMSALAIAFRSWRLSQGNGSSSARCVDSSLFTFVPPHPSKGEQQQKKAITDAFQTNQIHM